MKNELTEKQKRFVEEYVIDLNAAAAARRSGYAANNSDKIGSELLGKTRVHLAIQEKMKARSLKMNITAELIIQELAAIAFSNPQDFFEIKNNQIQLKNDILVDGKRSKAIGAVTLGKHGTTVHFLDRLRALDMLLKHIALNPKLEDDGQETGLQRIRRIVHERALREIEKKKTATDS